MRIGADSGYQFGHLSSVLAQWNEIRIHELGRVGVVREALAHCDCPLEGWVAHAIIDDGDRDRRDLCLPTTTEKPAEVIQASNPGMRSTLRLGLSPDDRTASYSLFLILSYASEVRSISEIFVARCFFTSISLCSFVVILLWYSHVVFRR